MKVIADPPGRLISVQRSLPESIHETSAAREHGTSHALNTAGVCAVADTAYESGRPTVRAHPQKARTAPCVPEVAGTLGIRRDQA